MAKRKKSRSKPMRRVGLKLIEGSTPAEIAAVRAHIRGINRPLTKTERTEPFN